MYQKIMLDHYYYIKTFSDSKTGENASRHITCERFEKATSRTNANFIWCHEFMFATVHVTDDDVRFCDGLRMLMHNQRPVGHNAHLSEQL